MNWKLYLGGAAFLTTALLSIAGCAGNVDSTNQSTANSTSIISPAEGNTPSDTETRGAAAGQRPSMPAIDYAAASVKLRVTEQQLKDALASDGQKPPDFSAAASALGVTEQALRDALGFPAGDQQRGNPPNGQRTGLPPGGTPKSN
jgi:hypothetical protein